MCLENKGKTSARKDKGLGLKDKEEAASSSKRSVVKSLCYENNVPWILVDTRTHEGLGQEVSTRRQARTS